MASLLDDIKKANQKPSLIDEVKAANKPKTLLEEINDANLRPEPRSEEGTDSTTGFPAPTTTLTTAPVPPSPPPSIRVALPTTLERPPIVEPPPSWWERMKIGMELSGEMIAARGEAEAKAGELVLDTLSKLDKPYNAVRVALHNYHYVAALKRKSYVRRGRPFAEQGLGKVDFTPEFNAFKEGLRNGWNQTEYRSYPDIEMMAFLGPDTSAKIKRWIDRHPALKVAHFANEFGQEFILENLAEMIVLGYVAKPAVRALATKTVIGGKVGFKVAPKWTAKQCCDLYIKRNSATIAASKKGFTDWMSMQHKINHPKIGLDGLIRENLDRPIESLTRPLTDWPATPTVVQIQELADLYNVKLKVKPGMDNAGHYDTGLFKGTVTLDESLVKTGEFPVPGDLPYTLNETYLHEIGHNVWFRKLDKTSRKSFSDVIEKLYITDNLQDTAEELFAITFYQLNAGKINDIDLPVLRGFNDVMKQAGLEDQFVRNMNQVMGEVLYRPDVPGVVETLGKARTEEVGKQLLRRKGAKLKGKPTPRVAKQASTIDRLVDLKQKYIKTLDDMADLDDRVVREIDPKIAEADVMLRHMDSDAFVTPAQYDIASKRLDALYTAKQHVLDTSETKWLAAEKIKAEIAGLESGTYINWEDISREIRGRYIDDSVAADVKPKNFGNQVKEIADTVSLGRLQEILGPDEFKRMNYKDTLPYLSDNEFMAAFDYIEIMKKAPADFKYATKVKPVLFGKEFAKPRRYIWMPFYDWFTPARLWYQRSGVPEIPKVGKQALVEQTRFIMKTIDGWEEALKPLGGKKITKDLPTMKRIFHIANGDFMEFRKLAKDAGLSNKKIADEFNAGRYISGFGDEMYEMWEASGRWPAGLKREKFYIRNIVDWTLEDAATDNVRLGQIAALQERGTFTKININEFRNRILKHDLPLVENADTALRMELYNHTYKYYMEPAFKQMKTFAALTGNEDVVTYTRRLINYGIRGESTPLERFADRTVFNNVAGALEKGTSILPWEKFHFHKQDRASKQLLNIYRRAVYAGTMGFNPGPIAKNVTQQLLNIPLTNTRSWFWGQQALFTEGGSGLSKHCDLIVGRVPFEDFDPTMFSKVEKLGSKGFRFVDKYPNVLGGFNANCIYLATRDDATRNILKRYGDFTNPYRNPNRAAQTIANAFDAGELKWLKEAANSRTTLAQYDYTAFGQPMAMIAGGPVTKAAFQFGTWSSNYYYGVLPEYLKAFMTGFGPNGVKLGMFERQVYLRHFLSMEGLSIAAGTMGIDMEKHRAPGPSAESPYAHAGGAAPTGPSPFASLGVGLLKWTLGVSRHDERMAAEGKMQMKRGLPFLPPVVIKKIYGVGWKDKPLSTLMFRLKEDEKSSWSGREPGAPSGPSVPTP